jgi:3-oxoadipate enol-lactonase
MSVRSIVVDGIQLSCEEQGAGRPVVLLHGFPLDRGRWQAQIAALSREFHVIAPDLRGFGQSKLAASDAEHGVAMDRYAADVLALLDALKVAEPVVLAGFSMGGYAAWQFALKWPDRLAALIQCDTRAIADNDEGRAGREKMAAAAIAAGDASPALAMLPKLLAPGAEQSQPQTVAMVKSMIERQSAEAVAAAQRGMARREDVSAQLAKINCPVLCMAGAEDAISTPAEMREIAAALPSASFIEIPAAGHMTTMENPAAVSAAMLEFIRGL